MKFDTVQSGWFIAYIEESQVVISPKTIVFLSLKINLVLANSADPDEMPHDVASFHLCHHCLPKFLFKGFWFTKG